MENIFQTETILDFSVYQAFQRNYANRVTTASRILLVLAVIYYYFHFDNPVFLFGYVIIALIVLAAQLIQNRKAGSTQYKRMLMSNNGKPNHAVIAFDDAQITDRNYDTGNSYTYQYDQVRYLIDAPDMLLIVLNYRMCLILQKNNLSGGTPEELIRFLQEKCPNMKRKKPRKVTFGKWLHRVMNGVLVVGILWALMNIPGFSLAEKLSGRLSNQMSYQEMAEELETAGIVISGQTIDEMEAYDAEYTQEWHKDYYRDNPRASKVRDLLYWEGSGIYDPDTMEWTPSASGIYWMDLEVWNVDSIYTDFLAGLDAMSDGITVTNLREDYSETDLEQGSGTVHVYFDLNGTQAALDAWYDYDWFDMEVIVAIGSMLESDADSCDLYVSSDDGQGLYFFYGAEETAKKLSRMTGLDFAKASQLYSLY